MANFTKDSILGEIVGGTGNAEKLVKHGVPCPTCPMAAMEMDKLTLNMIVETYGLDLEAILADLNG
ncbi:MAG: hypothetical protein WC519_02415 [Parcubacteria group bacterium]